MMNLMDDLVKSFLDLRKWEAETQGKSHPWLGPHNNLSEIKHVLRFAFPSI
jgi:hypothetical protein